MKIVRKISFIALAFAIVAVTFFAVRGGDIILKYLAENIGFEIEYANIFNFYDAVLPKHKTLEDFSLRIADAPILIRSPRGVVELDYSRLFAKQKIGLGISIDKPVVEFAHKKTGDNKDIVSMIPDEILYNSKLLAPDAIDSISMGLFLEAGKVEVEYITLYSKYIMLMVDGVFTDRGDADTNLKIYISPQMAADLPQEFVSILDDAMGGWKMYKASIKRDTSKALFSIDSPKIKVQIGGG